MRAFFCFAGAVPIDKSEAGLRGRLRVEAFGVEAASKTPCGRAPGFRDALSGGVGGSANHGYSWSYSTDESNCVYLHFYTLDLSPTNAYYRAHGFQLRCLSE